MLAAGHVAEPLYGNKAAPGQHVLRLCVLWLSLRCDLQDLSITTRACMMLLQCCCWWLGNALPLTCCAGWPPATSGQQSRAELA